MKKVQSSKWKDRSLILLSPIGEIAFDKDGIVELEDANATLAVETYDHITFVKKELSEEEKQKEKDIVKIMKIKKSEDLKDLASAYDEVETASLKTPEDYKNFLISKL